MTQFSSSDYMTAGLATMSRQVVCAGIAHAPYTTGEPLSTAAIIILKLANHYVQLSINILEQAVSAISILTEQSAFPLMLQISGEMDEMMATQIPLEEKHLAIFKSIRPLYLFASPLAWISLSNYIDSFQAQIDCHQAILDHYNSLWEYKTSKVNYVVDGDTIYVDAYETSIRIEGIDCPELDTEEGEAAKAYTEDRLLNQEVKLRARKKVDVYGRRVAKVFFPEDKNFAYELV
nr:thermonuclease family protein [Spirochaetales bacterium]